jgi:hypothetical protein
MEKHRVDIMEEQCHKQILMQAFSSAGLIKVTARGLLV